jgi:hypothetical protein
LFSVATVITRAKYVRDERMIVLCLRGGMITSEQASMLKASESFGLVAWWLPVIMVVLYPLSIYWTYQHIPNIGYHLFSHLFILVGVAMHTVCVFVLALIHLCLCIL